MAIINTAITDQGGGDYTHEILTVPAGDTYAVTNIMVCNTYDPDGASPAANTSVFDLHFVGAGSGGVLDVTKTCVVRRLSLPAGETFTFDSEKIVLTGSDKVVVVGDTPANLAVTLSYLEV